MSSRDINSSAQTGAQPGKLSRDNTAQRLATRAKVLARIRKYFANEQVTEVETPLLTRYAVTDPQLDNLRVDSSFYRDKHLYLTTSPEYAMKQLLSLGSGSIYQICKAFRQDPPGRLHSYEFTLLEWYRLGFDMEALIDDVAALVNGVCSQQINTELKVEKLSYREAFIRTMDLDPFVTENHELEAIATQTIDVSFTNQPSDVWLDLLLTHCVEPQLGKSGMTFLYDYPQSQAALARLSNDSLGNPVAKRFELYINGIELANGYYELSDADEQLKRFEHDNTMRQRMGKSACEIDVDLMAALQQGLPDCAGVALGIDRLILVLSELTTATRQP